MIARVWKGATRAENADAYTAYLQDTGLADYRATAGNRGALVLQRVAAGRAEFVVISFWESMEAVRGFAGEDPARAMFYPLDEAYLIERDQGVEHYEVAAADRPAARLGREVLP